MLAVLARTAHAGEMGPRSSPKLGFGRKAGRQRVLLSEVLIARPARLRTRRRYAKLAAEPNDKAGGSNFSQKKK
jgi:hypothetical protein